MIHPVCATGLLASLRRRNTLQKARNTMVVTRFWFPVVVPSEFWNTETWICHTMTIDTSCNCLPMFGTSEYKSGAWNLVVDRVTVHIVMFPDNQSAMSHVLAKRLEGLGRSTCKWTLTVSLSVPSFRFHFPGTKISPSLGVLERFTKETIETWDTCRHGRIGKHLTLSQTFRAVTCKSDLTVPQLDKAARHLKLWLKSDEVRPGKWQISVLWLLDCFIVAGNSDSQSVWVSDTQLLKCPVSTFIYAETLKMMIVNTIQFQKHSPWLTTYP